VICLSHLGYNYKNDPSICDVKLAELTKGYWFNNRAYPYIPR
jgi:hypothetical protein